MLCSGRAIPFVFAVAVTVSVLFVHIPLVFPSQSLRGSAETTNKHGLGAERALVQLPLSDTHHDKYNISDVWFPHESSEDQLWLEHNSNALRDLLACMQEGSCTTNQDKVVIVGSWFIRDSLLPTKFAGEHVWGRTTLKALEALGYTYVFATDNYDIVRIHKMFPSLVIAILMEPNDLDSCTNDETHCIKSSRNPLGIPVWKMLMFWYWPEARGPLGEKWTLSPEPYHRLSRNYPRNEYVGYSIEPSCNNHSVVPHSRRRDQAYFMSKKAQWFVQSWPRDFYDAAVDELGVEFVMGLHDSTATVPGNPNTPLAKTDIPFPKGVKDLGALQPSEFLSELSKSKVVIGLGAPVTSPTPYEALCLGVPFINPIKDWDHHRPTDRYSWVTQHDTLKFMDPPYVYNVYQSDKDGFVKAIQRALETPIGRYVLEDMKLSAIQKRLQTILERDHYGMAKAILEKRRAGIENGPIFAL